MSLALAGSGGVKGALGRLYLGARGYREGCLAILGFEGGEREASGRRARALALVRERGGLAVGRSPGEAWLKGRFTAPYLRDELLTHGVMVETLETATQWSNLRRLHRAVGEAIERALRESGTPGLVMCHVSHLYETGASLYFTFLARQREEDPIAQWRAAQVGDATGVSPYVEVAWPLERRVSHVSRRVLLIRITRKDRARSTGEHTWVPFFPLRRRLRRGPGCHPLDAGSPRMPQLIARPRCP